MNTQSPPSRFAPIAGREPEQSQAIAVIVSHAAPDPRAGQAVVVVMLAGMMCAALGLGIALLVVLL